MSSERLTPLTSWSQPQLDILDAAATAFMEGGYTATTLNDIADILGATKGRIYHYYRSKAAVFFDVMRRATCLLYDNVAPIATREEDPALRLKTMAVTHCRLTMEQYPYFRVTAGGVFDIPVAGAGLRARETLLRDYLALRDDYENLYSDVIAEGIQDHSFREVPPRVGSKAVLGALNWMTIWYRPPPSGEIPLNIAEELGTFVVNGLLCSR